LSSGAQARSSCAVGAQHAQVAADVALDAAAGAQQAQAGLDAAVVAALGQERVAQPVEVLRLHAFAERHEMVGDLRQQRAVGVCPVDEAALDLQVLLAPQQFAERGQPVAAGAADLLVVRLQRARHLPVHDRADRRLVDAHPERVGGEDQRVAALLERALLRAPLVRRQIAVVDERPQPAPLQQRLQRQQVADQRAVDDRRAAGALQHREQAQQLVLFVAAVAHREEQVLALDAGVEHRRRAEIQHAPHVRLHGRRGGRGEAEARRPAERAPHKAEQQVVGAEVVAPVAHAVDLVDAEARDTGAGDRVTEPGHAEPLRRHVEQLRAPRPRVGEPPFALVAVEHAVHAAGRQPAPLQRLDLVLHQRDERAHAQREALADERGQLVAQRLALARRHHHQRRAAAEQVARDLLLRAAERRVAEQALQLGAQVDGGHRGQRSA
jgi:hypothetical protein